MDKLEQESLGTFYSKIKIQTLSEWLRSHDEGDDLEVIFGTDGNCACVGLFSPGKNQFYIVGEE